MQGKSLPFSYEFSSVSPSQPFNERSARYELGFSCTNIQEDSSCG
jgi:hypothetical protein